VQLVCWLHQIKEPGSAPERHPNSSLAEKGTCRRPRSCSSPGTTSPQSSLQPQRPRRPLPPRGTGEPSPWLAILVCTRYLAPCIRTEMKWQPFLYSKTPPCLSGSFFCTAKDDTPATMRSRQALNQEFCSTSMAKLCGVSPLISNFCGIAKTAGRKGRL